MILFTAGSCCSSKLCFCRINLVDFIGHVNTCHRFRMFPQESNKTNNTDMNLSCTAAVFPEVARWFIHFFSCTGQFLRFGGILLPQHNFLSDFFRKEKKPKYIFRCLLKISYLFGTFMLIHACCTLWTPISFWAFFFAPVRFFLSLFWSPASLWK